MQLRSIFASVAVLALAACSDSQTTAPLSASDAPNGSQSAQATGGVFVSTNDVNSNAIVAFARAADGSLTPMGTFATGGTGIGGVGDPLASQFAVALSPNAKVLVVVNAGSNEVSSFEVGDNGALTLRGKAPSGGTMPISVTIHGNLVYALNAGGTGNISGLRLNGDGSLSPIAGSTRGLSASDVGPAEVSFDPSGAWLVVTEKNTNKIDTWRVGSDGLATGRVVNASAGVTPFGFTFTSKGILTVTEAFGGAVDGSAVSSYTINGDGTLTTITASAPTTETSACWIVATNSSKFVYATNANSASITGYSVQKGSLDRLAADGKSGNTGAGATDLAITENSQFVYSLNGGAHTITGFGVSQSNGSLDANGAVSVPTGAVGLAAK